MGGGRGQHADDDDRHRGLEAMAGKAKANCPISKLLKAEINLEAELLS